MRIVVATISITLFVAAAVVDAQRRTDPALDALASGFARAFTQKDVEKVTSFYADDATLMPPGQPAVRGREAIEAYFRRGFSLDFVSMDVTPLESAVAGAIAFEAGASRLVLQSGPTPDARGPGNVETGKYLLIYKRVGNEWKIAYDIFNDD
jgi:ketosteroid isomerase-like protein